MSNEGIRSNLATLIAENTIIPSDQMVIRRYMPSKYFRSTFKDGYRFGLAEGYEKQEGQISPFSDQQMAMRREKNKERLKENDGDGDNLLEDMKLNNGETPDFEAMMNEGQKAARWFYFANCWRLGTDESKQIWKDYTEENMVEGVAIETTVGQFRRHLAPKNDSIKMGAVWYIDREEEPTPISPPFSPFFFKGKKYDDEQEFRALYNKGGNPVYFADGREYPEEMLPDRNDSANLQGNHKEIINRIILAPNANSEVRILVEDVLNDYNLDIDIVESQLTGEPISQIHEYGAELGATDNYGGDPEYLNETVDGFLNNTDWEQWETVDIVMVCWKGRPFPRWTFVECYRHSSTEPQFKLSDYSHHNPVYEIRAYRYQAGNEKARDHYFNSNARETEKALRDIDHPGR